MAVLAIKTEPKCKLCNHAQRPAIDQLIERRSNQEKGEAGNRINLEYVLRVLGEWGVVNPTEENIKNHWRRHCEKMTDEAVQQVMGAAQEALNRMDSEGVVVDVNQDLDWMWAIGIAEMRERVARGERSGLTVDILLKVAAEKGRRQHNESQDELLRSLAGGIEGAFKQAAVQLGRGTKELPPVQVIEATEVEFSEVPS